MEFNFAAGKKATIYYVVLIGNEDSGQAFESLNYFVKLFNTESGTEKVCNSGSKVLSSGNPDARTFVSGTFAEIYCDMFSANKILIFTD